MKDSSVKACVGMVMVTTIYGIYVFSHAIAGEPIPDGILLSGVAATVAGLAGYTVASAKTLEKKG